MIRKYKSEIYINEFKAKTLIYDLKFKNIVGDKSFLILYEKNRGSKISEMLIVSDKASRLVTFIYYYLDIDLS